MHFIFLFGRMFWVCERDSARDTERRACWKHAAGGARLQDRRAHVSPCACMPGVGGRNQRFLTREAQLSSARPQVVE